MLAATKAAKRLESIFGKDWKFEENGGFVQRQLRTSRNDGSRYDKDRHFALALALLYFAGGDPVSQITPDQHAMRPGPESAIK